MGHLRLFCLIDGYERSASLSILEMRISESETTGSPSLGQACERDLGQGLQYAADSFDDLRQIILAGGQRR